MVMCLIHPCLNSSASITSPQTLRRPIFPLHLRLFLCLTVCLHALLWCFALPVEPNAGQIHLMANAKDVWTRRSTLSRACAARRLSSIIIQVPQLRARLLQPFQPLALMIVMLGHPRRSVCAWHPHRTVRQDPLISFMLFSSLHGVPRSGDLMQ